MQFQLKSDDFAVSCLKVFIQTLMIDFVFQYPLFLTYIESLHGFMLELKENIF